MIARQMPMQDHPLTRAHMMGARATTHQTLAQAAKLIHELEKRETEQTIAACKLAAEVLIERKMP